MKNYSIILIFFLFFSYSCLASYNFKWCGTEDPSYSDCFDSVKYKNKKSIKRYDGFFVNGVPHGHGRMIFKDGNEIYSDFKNGDYNGKTQLFIKGNTYEMEYLNGELLGDAKFAFKGKPTDYPMGMNKSQQQTISEMAHKNFPEPGSSRVETDHKLFCQITYVDTFGVHHYLNNITGFICLVHARQFLLYGVKKLEQKILYERKQQEEKELKLQLKKKSKDYRGIWDINFNDTENDLIKKNCKSSLISSDMICRNEDREITHVKIGNDGFPYHFYRNFGSFTSTGLSNYKSKLNNRYKIIMSPTKQEEAKFMYGKTNLNYYFKNTKKYSKKPLYITLFTAKNLAKEKSIYIGYYSKDYFENYIRKTLNRKKKKENDL